MDGTMESTLEIYVSDGGSYLGLNEAASRTLGYSVDAIRALPLGALSGSTEAAAQRVWRALVDDGLAIPPNADIRLRAKDGRQVAVRFVGSERLEPGRWVSRYRLLANPAAVSTQPFLLQTLLAQWRELERRVSAAGSGSTELTELERQLAEVRALYQAEHQRRRGPGDAMP